MCMTLRAQEFRVGCYVIVCMPDVRASLRDSIEGLLAVPEVLELLDLDNVEHQVAL